MPMHRNTRPRRIFAFMLSLVLIITLPALGFLVLAEDNINSDAPDGGENITSSDDTGNESGDNKSESSEDESSKTESNKTESSETESSETESSEAESSKDESSEAESSETESSEAESSETESSESESSEAESSETESSESESSDAESSEDESSEAESSEESNEAAMLELTDKFSQFVTKAILVGADGKELPESAEVKLGETVKLRLTAEFDLPTLAAIYEGKDAEYAVHIPELLAAKTGHYELKTDGKLLGTLRVDASGAFFVFNTEDESLFDENEAKDLKNLTLDITCGFNAAMAEFTVDLGEYKDGKTYAVKLVLTIVPLDLPVALNPIGDFSQFVENATLVDASGAEINDGYIMWLPGSVSEDKGNDRVTLKFNLYDLDGTELMSIMNDAWGPYEVKIPSMLKAVTGEYPITVKGSSEPLGTVTIDSNGKATFRFNEDATDIFDGETAIVRNLWISLTCVLNEDAIGTNDENVIVDLNPYNNNTYNVTIGDKIPKPIPEPGEAAMSKTGSKNAASGNYDWKVTVTPPGLITEGAPQEAELVYGPFADTFGLNHMLTGTIKVSGGSYYDPDGDPNKIIAFTETIIDPSTDSRFEAVKDGAGKTIGFKLNFENPFVSPGDVVITYTTTLTNAAFGSDSGTVDISNDAKIEYGKDESAKTASASASVPSESIAVWEKSGEYNAAARSITWTIEVDTLGQGYSYLTLFDQMTDAANIKYIDGSIRVNGNELTGAALAAMQVNTTTGLMTLPIWKEDANLYPGQSKLVITYKTSVPEGYIDYTNPNTEEVENKAWLEYGWNDRGGDGDGGTMRMNPVVSKTESVSAPLRKEAAGYNSSAREMTWKITVNSNSLELNEVEITDILGPGQEYVRVSPLKTSGNNSGAAIGHTTETVGDIEQHIFKIPLLADEPTSTPDLNAPASFTVTTIVTDPDFLASNGKKTLTNSASMLAKWAKNGSDVKGSGSASTTPTNNVLSKSGEYDYSTHEMKWTVLVNADKIDNFVNVTVKDTMPAEQTLVSGSITGVTADKVSQAGQVLTFNLGDISETMVTITYKTTHTGLKNNTVEDMEFDNTAELTVDFDGDDPQQPVKVTATQVVAPLNPLQKRVLGVNKLDDTASVVTFRVLINQSNVAFTNAVTLKDKMTITGQADIDADVDPSSVKCYEATLNPDGTFSFNKSTSPLVGITGVAFDSDPAVRTLTLTIPANTKACVLEYDELVWHTKGEKLLPAATLKNSIQFDGMAIIGDDDYSSDATASLGKASGSDADGALEKYLKVQIKKIDEKEPNAFAENKLVAGAEFGLYLNKDDGKGYVPKASGKTDATGMLNFNLLMPSYDEPNEYYIKEEKAATGYMISNGDYIQINKSGAFGFGTEDGLPARTYGITLTNDRDDTYPVNFSKVYLDALDGNKPKLLEGAKFKLTADKENGYNNDTTLPPVTDNGNGTFTISGLKWGTYTLVEETTPTDYVVNNATYTLKVSRSGAVTIEHDTGTGAANTTPAVTTYDSKPAIVNEQGSLAIQKVDALDQTNIQKGDSTEFSNATFKLWESASNAYNGTQVALTGSNGVYYIAGTGGVTTGVATNDNGEIVFNGLKAGKYYYATEVSAPTGYSDAKLTGFDGEAIAKSDIFYIDTTEGIHYGPIKLDNERKDIYSFWFYKYVQNYTNGAKNGTSAANDGALKSTFELYTINSNGTKGTKVADASTDANGMVVFENIAFNKYYIVETDTPDGYAFPRASSVANAPEAAMEVDLKRSTETTGGATWIIKDLSRGGAVTISSDISSPFINEKGSYTIQLEDNLYTGTDKTNLADATFVVTGSDGSSVTITTDSTGKAFIDGLTTGVTYTFTPEDAPRGYNGVSGEPTFTPSTTGKKGTDGVDDSTTIKLNRTEDLNIKSAS